MNRVSRIKDKVKCSQSQSPCNYSSRILAVYEVSPLEMELEQQKQLVVRVPDIN